MKKHLMLAVMALMLAACGSKETKSGDVEKESDPQSAADSTVTEADVPELKTDTVSFHKEKGICTVGLSVDFPVEGNDSLVKAIASYIIDYIGGTPQEMKKGTRQTIQALGEELFNDFIAYCGDVDEDEYHELFLYKQVNKTLETPTFVTFTATTSNYLGGLHPQGKEEGCTFSKKNGTSFSYDMMTRLDTPAFKQLVKEGLRNYFGVNEEGQPHSDEELTETLTMYDGSIDDLPLPDAEPYLTDQGITFIYQSYEITFYAAGRPTFTIPFSEAKPFLKPQALNLFLND